MNAEIKLLTRPWTFKAFALASILLVLVASIGFFIGNKISSVYLSSNIHPSKIEQKIDTITVLTQENQSLESDDTYYIPPTSQEAANWEMYQSYNDGYSIKYPGDWILNTYHKLSLTKNCDYEKGQKCPHIELTKEEVHNDDLESYFNMSPEPSEWPDKVLNTFSTTIAGSDAVGRATLIGNHYCGDTKSHGDCPLLTIEYKFFHVFEGARYVYSLTYNEQTKNQLDISSIKDLEFFDEFKTIASTLSLYPASIVFRKENDYSLLTFDTLGMSMKIPKTVAIYPARGTVDVYVGIEKIDQSDAQDYMRFTAQETRSKRTIGGVEAHEGIVFESLMQCDIAFVRNLQFYKDGHNVVVSTRGNDSQIMKSMPEYFSADYCWKDTSSLKLFVDALKKGQGNSAAQEWYDSFDTMIQTLSFSEKASNKADYWCIIERDDQTHPLPRNSRATPQKRTRPGSWKW